jgi:hypothetical protein
LAATGIFRYPPQNGRQILSGLVEMSKNTSSADTLRRVMQQLYPGAAASQANTLFHFLGQLGAAVEFDIDPLAVLTLLNSGISHDIAELVKVTRT